VQNAGIGNDNPRLTLAIDSVVVGRIVIVRVHEDHNAVEEREAGHDAEKRTESP
jgi:hypothetical protein